MAVDQATGKVKKKTHRRYSDYEARTIREWRHELGMSLKDLGKLFGNANENVIHAVVKGYTYKTAGGPIENDRYKHHWGASKVRKFSAEQILAIKTAEGKTGVALACEYGVSESMIRRIRAGQSYKDVG